MTIYEDDKGWIYKVIARKRTDGSREYKAIYINCNGSVKWQRFIKRLPFRETAGEAQEDLDNYAAERQMKIYRR